MALIIKYNDLQYVPLHKEKGEQICMLHVVEVSLRFGYPPHQIIEFVPRRMLLRDLGTEYTPYLAAFTNVGVSGEPSGVMMDIGKKTSVRDDVPKT